MSSLTAVETHKDILTLTSQNFDHQLKGKLVLVDFWAEWCAPCKVMLPILNEVAESSNDNFIVAKVDVDKNQALAQKHNIRSIPSLVAFKAGKEVARFVGIKNKKFLLGEMEKLK
ncbi:MAG: thioredoxin [Porphyromonadaceae bacterium]|nr:thioredoxin [Porphyromonadaceae bacterium]